MSTRATYQFVDDYNDVTVYKHHDGYPKGAYDFIIKALEYAWALPRFEANDFAAAFIAANKGRGGGDVCTTVARYSHKDTEYHYVITYEQEKTHEEKKLFVRQLKRDAGRASPRHGSWIEVEKVELRKRKGRIDETT